MSHNPNISNSGKILSHGMLKIPSNFIFVYRKKRNNFLISCYSCQLQDAAIHWLDSLKKGKLDDSDN